MVATVISYRHHPSRVSNRRSVELLELGVPDGLVGEEGEAVTDGTDVNTAPGGPVRASAGVQTGMEVRHFAAGRCDGGEPT